MRKCKDEVYLVVKKVFDFCLAIPGARRGGYWIDKAIRSYDDKQYAMKVCSRLNRDIEGANDPMGDVAMYYDMIIVPNIWNGP